jgi:hypothetical protein
VILPPPLAETLARVAERAAAARDRWWIIGSAAVALHGAAPVEVADVDLLMSPRDARAFLAAVSSAPLDDAGTPLFRSAVFGRWHAPPLTVEIMADLYLAGSDPWWRVQPATREAVGDLFVPSRDELRALLVRFGRPKDLARAMLLADLPANLA